ncbi:MAG: DUF4097 family beta strand repeat-containing protein [Candidatus Krumholzibacteriota bacterium]
MKSHRLTTPMAFLILFTLLAGAALAAEFEKEFTFEGKELLVSNMIGAIKIKEGSSAGFRVLVSIRGEDAAEHLLDFMVEDDGKNTLAIKFPLDDHTKYTYPALGRNSSSTIHFQGEGDHGGSWLKKIFSGISGKKVTVKGKGNGLEMWADVTIEVPARHILEVRHGVGEILAVGLEADLNLDTHSGPISVENLQGDLLADTGSGRVAALGVEGEVNIDTGSGSVHVANCRGSEVKVDTGSGAVEAELVDCKYMLIDTGSGGVKARAIKADKAKIDTGSGSVTLQMDRMGDGRFVIDTGSGSIELVLPADASARITADTGSGSCRNKVDGADVRVAERDELEMTVGDGLAMVVLDAGSGSITVRQK